jgi:predicted amidophosphoribosyltransferase
MSRSGATIGVGAVMIPVAFGWTYLYGRMTVLLCLKCRKQIPGDSRFCPSCGVDLYGAPPPLTPTVTPEGRSFCTACGKPLRPQARFCGSCGAPVS